MITAASLGEKGERWRNNTSHVTNCKAKGSVSIPVLRVQKGLNAAGGRIYEKAYNCSFGCL